MLAAEDRGDVVMHASDDAKGRALNRPGVMEIRDCRLRFDHLAAAARRNVNSSSNAVLNMLQATRYMDQTCCGDSQPSRHGTGAGEASETCKEVWKCTRPPLCSSLDSACRPWKKRCTTASQPRYVSRARRKDSCTKGRSIGHDAVAGHSCGKDRLTVIAG